MFVASLWSWRGLVDRAVCRLLLKMPEKLPDYLGIPHYTCDFRDVFEKNVISYFCREYLEVPMPKPVCYL